MRDFLENVFSAAFLLPIVFAACVANLYGSGLVGLTVWCATILVFKLKNGW